MQFLTITWNVDPELISIGPIHVRYYGALFVCAFIASYFLFLRMFKREKIPVPLLENLTVIVAISTFVGARLGHCLFYQPGYFLAHPLEIILPVQFSPYFKIIGYQVLASHGAAIGILIGLWYFCRKHKKNYIWVLDRIAIAIPLAGCLVRIGNLMNSEIYGDVTNLSWGFILCVPMKHCRIILRSFTKPCLTWRFSSCYITFTGVNFLRCGAAHCSASSSSGCFPLVFSLNLLRSRKWGLRKICSLIWGSGSVYRLL